MSQIAALVVSVAHQRRNGCIVVPNTPQDYPLMTYPTKPGEVRLTIPVTAATYAVFARISASSGVPLGRCMASWLGDTLDAADFMAGKLEAARSAPRILSRELHSYAAGLSVALDQVLERAQGSGAAITPPSSNTGGKLSSRRVSCGAGGAQHD